MVVAPPNIILYDHDDHDAVETTSPGQCNIPHLLRQPTSVVENKPGQRLSAVCCCTACPAHKVCCTTWPHAQRQQAMHGLCQLPFKSSGVLSSKQSRPLAAHHFLVLPLTWARQWQSIMESKEYGRARHEGSIRVYSPPKKQKTMAVVYHCLPETTQVATKFS